MMIFSILEQALMALPLIVGAYFTLSLLKLPDFSIESAYLFGAVCAFLAKDLPLPVVLLCSIGGGMAVGFLVSLLNQVFHIPFLLAAIIVGGLCHGMTQYLLGTSVKSFHIPLPFPEITFFLLIALSLFVMLGCVIRSQLGYSWAIYGNNPNFFRHHPISGRFIIFSGVMVGHACAGISGFLFAQSNGFVDLTMNFGVILLCLTAMMIGRLFISTGRPNLLLPIIGIFAFFVIQQSLLRVGLNLKYFNAFQALFILAILTIGHRKQSLTVDHLGV